MVKVKLSHYRPGQAQRVPGGWGSQISWQSAHEGGKVVSPTHQSPLPKEIFLVPISVGGWTVTYEQDYVCLLILYLDLLKCSKVQTSSLLTYSMVQSPSWEANWFAASQEIPRILWNPKIHYRTHKRPPPVPILGQPNPVHIPTSHFPEIHPNIIHPSTPRSPHWSLSLRFPHQDPIHPSLLAQTRHMPSPSHSSRFYPRTILGEEYRSFSSSLCRNLKFQPVSNYNLIRI